MTYVPPPWKRHNCSFNNNNNGNNNNNDGDNDRMRDNGNSNDDDTHSPLGVIFTGAHGVLLASYA